LIEPNSFSSMASMLVITRLHCKWSIENAW